MRRTAQHSHSLVMRYGFTCALRVKADSNAHRCGLRQYGSAAAASEATLISLVIFAHI